MSLKVLKFSLLFFISFLISCKTNRTVNKEREGKWIYRDTINEVIYKSKGRYKNGVEQKTWRHFANNKYLKKEKYKNDICYVTTYFEKGKIASEGKTKMTITDSKTHWFYFGDWLYYNEKEELISIKTYVKGELVKEEKK